MAKIPSWWQHQPLHSTQRELFAARKQDFLPSKTFDIDGDGEVGPTDLFIASCFDREKKRTFDQSQLNQVREAVANGFIDQFEMGLEAQGAHKGTRQLQVRGQIVKGDDYSKVRETYPLNPAPNPTFRTRTELHTHRKLQTKALAEAYTEANFQYNQPILRLEHQERVPAELKVPLKTLNRQFSRVDQGMNAEPDGMNAVMLSTQYVSQPHHRSCIELRQKRKEDLIQQQERACNYNHMDPIRRLNEREAQYAYTGQPGIVYGDILAQTRQKDLDHNVKYFANRSLGIHGKELPKFREQCPEYWTKQSNYNPQPVLSMKKPKEGIHLSRSERFLKPKTAGVAEKPTRHNPFTDTELFYERVYVKPTVRKDPISQPTAPAQEKTQSMRHSQSMKQVKANANLDVASRPISTILHNQHRALTVRTGGFTKP